MSRKNAREDTFRLIFEGMINKCDTSEQLNSYFDAVNTPADIEGAFINTPKGGDNEYVKTVLTGVFENTTRLDEIISSCLKDWNFERVSKVSVAAMRLALFEMINLDDVPIGVSINEAVDIVKKYDGEQSGSFVNGALSSAAKSLVKKNGD